jgi:ankyrin
MASPVRHLSGALWCGTILLISTCLAQQPATPVPSGPDDSKNLEEFRAAITSSDVKKVASLIQQNPQQVNENLPGLGAPLVTAVLCGAKDDVAILLVTNHADLEARDAAGRSALYCAVARGDAPLTEFLLNHGANVDAPDNQGLTPLNFAAENGWAPTVALLLKFKANVNARDNRGFTPLIRATGNMGVVKQLLDAGADINACVGTNTVVSMAMNNPSVGPETLQMLLDRGADPAISGANALEGLALSHDLKKMQFLVPYYLKAKTPVLRTFLDQALGVAMAQGRADMVSAIVESVTGLEMNPVHRTATLGDDAALRTLLAGHPELVDQTDGLRWTPLHMAAINDQEVVAESLLSGHANINAQDEIGNTPLYWAAFLGHEKMVALLLRHRPNTGLKGNTVRTSLGGGRNRPLDIAVQQGFTSIATMLIAQGAAPDSAGGNDALPTAVTKGDAEDVALLLAHGANPNLPVHNWLAPLDLAVIGDSPAVVQLLLAHGANIHTQAANAGNLFHSWATHGNAAIGEQILAAGCDINGLDRDGRTPLEVAAKNGQFPAMQWLVDHRAQVNIADKNGLTPLYFAAQASGWGDDSRDGLAVALLLSHQADPNVVDKDGMTPLLFATRFGVKESVELLLDHGANIDAAGPGGRTALAMAEAGEHHSIERRLDYHDIAVLLRAHGAKEPTPAVPSDR